MKGRTGFIGLGVMGTSMARNLLRGGFEVTVFNRTREREAVLLSEGAKSAVTPRAVADGIEVLFLCVTNGLAVDEMLFGKNGAAESLRPGTVVVDFSTIAPSDARRFAAKLSAHSISFLDAPVTGGDVGARNGTLTIMVGGDPRALEKVKPMLESMGKRIIHVGDSGNGQLTKCVNQIGVVGSIAAMTEALFFAGKLGLDPATSLEVIRGGGAGSWSLENYGPRVLSGDFEPGFHVKHLLKDLRIVLEESDAAGISLPVTSLLKEYYTALGKGKGAERGVHALISLYERFDSGNE